MYTREQRYYITLAFHRQIIFPLKLSERMLYMKQESKEIINWIKKQINLAKECCIDVVWNGKHEYYNADYEKAMKFLDSLPQIESRLCRGGYIQDSNGIPCHDGDKVRFEFEDGGYEENWKNRYEKIIEGKLQFSTETKSFAILFGEGKNGWDWIDWNTSDWGCKWFEKIEE